MNREQRLEEILSELACRSADVPRNMLPIPFDGELILDFGEEVVKDLKSKKEILKFERSWVEMVEEEEVRQKNLSKMESELKAMSPQIKLKEKMQEELMKVAPKKIVKLRQTFLAIEKSRKYWKTIHEELKIALVERDQQKMKFHHQKSIMSEVLKEIEVVASRDLEKRSEREERRNTIQRVMHQELMAVLTKKNLERKQNKKQKETMALMLKELKVVASKELKRLNERTERRETIWKAIHKELMVVSVKRDQEKIEFNHQKKIMSEVLKELQVVASREIKKRSEREERRNTIQRAMHQELMAVLTKKNLERKQNTKQKEMMALMLKELKVVALRELKSRNEREERRETIWKAIHKELIKFNKGTNPEDEEEDLFVPRKLFIINVDTFKNFPQNVETTQCHKETEIKKDLCTSSVGQVPTPPKKKSFRGRLRKLFGLK